MNSNNINLDINELILLLNSLDRHHIENIQKEDFDLSEEQKKLLRIDLIKYLCIIKSNSPELIYSILSNIVSLLQINTISISNLDRFISSISNTFINCIDNNQLRIINNIKLAKVTENSTSNNIINLCTKLANSSISQKSIKNILRNIS